MNVQDCFDKRLLRKITPDKIKSQQSLKISELKLDSSKKLFEEGFFSEALINSYISMFHASRALLYEEGVQEKSHYAIYIYLNEKFSKKISVSLIESFRNYQLERHNAIYGFESEINSNKAESSITDAEDFLLEVKQILS